MKFLFLIRIDEGEPHSVVATSERPVIVMADDLKAACRKMHAVLRGDDPDLWTDDWRDLYHDIREGNQTCYGPFTDIPIVD
jgi:hypothetical protein